MRKILILAANPNDVPLSRLDEEVRDIYEALDRAQKRDEFEVVQRWAVRPRDLQRAMLEVLPQIVHFTGHSDGTAGLFFEDVAGQAKLVTGEALARLFKLFEDELECVVLNGCYSYDQAAAIAEHVPHVIGMQWAVNERAAIEFAVGFYDALGSGRPVEFAFEFGKTAMELAGAGDSEMPVLWPDAFAEVDESVNPQTGLKLGAPFPRVRLPENYVERPDALNTVKAMLLAEDERTLVVSAISGLGGLGKSVLATALVLDIEVQSRFSDGILLVTLGQNPDLLTMLGDWIRELDKSRESFSANTLKAASKYLGNLLTERRILLVVDDVWNAAHAEWFRVGGSGCRVLVTTREAVIAGAERYSLDLMSPQESLELVKGELGAKWTAEMEKPALEFAQIVGYLPLAVRLMAVQVARGRKWETLKKAFLKAAKGLRALDYPGVRLTELSEEEQRKYSLQACFQVSLDRLKEDSLEYFERFVWLGVLPEDVILQQTMATTLWDVEDWEAEETLLILYERSFLTSGIATIDGDPTYRVHDLMHDMACNLIEQGNLKLSIDEQCDLSRNKNQNLLLAHWQFLERYRNVSTDNCWHTLPDDGYIHRHLTWHLEQGNWVDEIHSLIKTSDVKGRNAWFEVCDRIGQPAIFVKDVARGWKLAKDSYAQEKFTSVVLQCRYALITATLNSLVRNLPTILMTEFVKQRYWSIEQAWTYVEQIQSEEKIIEAVHALAPYLSKSLFHVAIDRVCEIQSESSKTSVLSALAKVDGANFDKLLSAARELQDKSNQASVLSELAKVNGSYFDEALSAARELRNERTFFKDLHQASMLRELAKVDGADFNKLLSAARKLKDKSIQASMLSKLAKVNKAYFDEALSAARELQDECTLFNRFGKVDILSELAKVDGADFNKLLSAACELQNEDSRASVLSELAKVDGADLNKLSSIAHELQDRSIQASMLSGLAKVNKAYFDEALSAACELQDEHTLFNRFGKIHILSKLVEVDGADFNKLLSAARELQNEYSRASVLRELAKVDGANFNKLLSAAHELQNEDSRASVLRELAKVDGANFNKLLSAALEFLDEDSRASVLSELAKVNGAYFDEALSAARELKNDNRRASMLKELAKVDRADFDKLLSAARKLWNRSIQASVLSELAKVNKAYFDEALSAARELQDEDTLFHRFRKVDVLSKLVEVDGANFDKLLSAARELQNDKSRASVLSELAKVDGAYFDEALSAARELQNDNIQASMLRELSKVDGADFDKLLSAARELQSKSDQASILRELAKLDGAYFDEALSAARELQNDNIRVSTLRELAKVDGADFDKLLSAVRELQSKSDKASILRELAKVDGAYFDEALSTARELQDEFNRASMLRELSKVDGADFDKLLSIAHELQDKSIQASVLSELAKVNKAYFDEALSTARELQDERTLFNRFGKVDILSELVEVDGANFDKLLSAACELQDEGSRTDVLSELAKVDGANFDKLLSAAREFLDEDSRASVLSELAKVNGAYFEEALSAACKLQDEVTWSTYSDRADVLSELAKVDGADFDKLLSAARELQDENNRANLLSELAKVDGADFDKLLSAARELQDENNRANLLSELAKVDGADFDKLLSAVRELQDENNRANLLRNLTEQGAQDFFPNVKVEIYNFDQKLVAAEALSRCLTYFLSIKLHYTDWQSFLHLLAYRKRSDLMQDLVTLYPAIIHLGGEEAMRGVVDAMKDVCSQWK